MPHGHFNIQYIRCVEIVQRVELRSDQGVCSPLMSTLTLRYNYNIRTMVAFTISIVTIYFLTEPASFTLDTKTNSVVIRYLR